MLASSLVVAAPLVFHPALVLFAAISRELRVPHADFSHNFDGQLLCLGWQRGRSSLRLRLHRHGLRHRRLFLIRSIRRALRGSYRRLELLERIFFI